MTRSIVWSQRPQPPPGPRTPSGPRTACGFLVIAITAASAITLVSPSIVGAQGGGAKFSVIGDFGAAAVDKNDNPPPLSQWHGACPTTDCANQCPAPWDFGYNSEAFVKDQVNSQGSALIVTLGDNNYEDGCGDVPGVGNFLTMNIGNFYDKTQLRPAIGNHDYHTGSG